MERRGRCVRRGRRQRRHADRSRQVPERADSQSDRIAAVEPKNSSALLGHEPGFHQIQGIGDGFIPPVLDVELIDEVITVTRRRRDQHHARAGVDAGLPGGDVIGRECVVGDASSRRSSGPRAAWSRCCPTGPNATSARVCCRRRLRSQLRRARFPLQALGVLSRPLQEQSGALLLPPFFRFPARFRGCGASGLACLPAAGLSLSSTACRRFLAAMASASVVSAGTGFSTNGASVMSKSSPDWVSFHRWLRTYHLPFSST